jgi:hypothetical protein
MERNNLFNIVANLETTVASDLLNMSTKIKNNCGDRKDFVFAYAASVRILSNNVTINFLTPQF